MHKPPPLQLLPAFEAAARLLSFSKAAQELHVTTAAISQQIKQLEGHLGLSLFRRLTRRVELTDAGQQFAEVVGLVLSNYRQGHADLLHRFTQPVLRMSTSPLVVHEFLLPRMAAFQAAHPGVKIQLEGNMDFADFDKDPIDAAIRVGSGDWPGLEAWPLCDCEAVVLASPSLLAQRPVQHFDDLRHHTLIHPRASHLDWDTVGRFAQVSKLVRQGDLVLDSDLAALQAAKKGLGLAVVVIPANASSDLARLEDVVPVFPPLRIPNKAFFVFRPHSGKEDLLRSAFTWIRAHIAPEA